MIKPLPWIILLLGLLTLGCAGVEAASRHDKTAPLWIVYRGMETYTYVVQANGSHDHEINPFDPRFAIPPEDRVVYRIRIDRIEQQNMVPYLDTSPLWSPDGQWIYFVLNDRTRGSQIYRMRPDGSDQQQITHSQTGKNDLQWARVAEFPWYPWRTIVIGIGLVAVALIPWRKAFHRIRD